MPRKSSALFLAVFAVAGCKLSTDLPPLKPISLVTLRSIPDVSSSTGYVAQALAYFFSERGFSYADSHSPTNSCAGPQPLITSGTGPSQWLNPGQPTQLTLKGPGVPPRTVQLLQGTPDAQDPNVYTNAFEPTLYPGSDSAIVTVPGAAGGFPAIDVRGKTVEDFTFDPVADSGGTGGLALHWTPSTNSNSAMEIDLVYQTDPTASGLNAQVVCVVIDDGDFSVPRSFLLGWETAGEDDNPLDHQVRFIRYLTATTTAGDASILLINTLNKTEIK
jgi:hypothetical protein